MRLAASTNRFICAAGGKTTPTALCLGKPPTATTSTKIGYARMKCGLAKDVDRLIERQTASWAMLAQGLDGLSRSQTRAERVAGRDVLVRHIPHRIVSTTAAVDPASVSRRPCFLCPANLPPGRSEEHTSELQSRENLVC